jgi:hypothetical protein
LLLAPLSTCLAAPVTVTVSMHDPAALEVGYEIPSACQSLVFSNPDIGKPAAAALRGDWTALDECTEVDADGVRPRHPGCTKLRVRVPATTRAQDIRVYDRVYPWALPVGNGLMSHTSAFAVAPGCGLVDWRFATPRGTVVVDGVVSAEQAVRGAGSADAGYLPIVLLAEPYRPDAPPVHVDATVDAQARALLDATTLQLKREYAAMLPGLPVPLPYLVVAASDMPTTRSAVAHRSVLGLTLPVRLAPDARTALQLLIAHESAHLAQGLRDKDTWADEATTINEGGAEFLSLVAPTRLGWITPAEFTEKLEYAANECVLALKGKSWKRAEQHSWGRLPYSCGTMFYAIGLNENPTGPAPLTRIRDYERRAQAGTPTDFASALECGDTSGCMPRWLPRIGSADSLDTVLRDYMRSAHALLRPGAHLNPSLATLLANRHFSQLMAADCHGAVSVYALPGEARIGPVSGCAMLREGMRVTAAEGHPLFTGAEGLQASIEACRARGKTVLGLKDGDSVTLACDASFDLPADLLIVDADKALRLTK